MKPFRKKIWCIVGICVLCAALIAGSIAYFGFILPKQKEHREHMKQVQQYRDNKMAQYRAENEKYADYEEFILLKLKYYSQLKQGDKIKELIKNVQSGKMFVSRKVKEAIAFWKD